MSWETLVAAVAVAAVSCVYWWFCILPTGTRLSFLHMTGKFSLDPETARRQLFETILDDFARSHCFSFPSDISPNIFIVYAHNNEKEGAAYDGCARQLITWLERIHAKILSDQSPLPPFSPRVEGTKAIGNILANQMCILPPSCGGTPIRSSVDKIIVCGSEVLEAYCRKPSARTYIEDIVRICTSHVGTPKETKLEPIIRDRVEKECGRDDFHHVLTELAFIEARVHVRPETHDLVPIVLNQIDPDEHPMQYLPCFRNTDVKLKLKLNDPSSLYTLFFKLLKRLYPEQGKLIRPYEKFYTSNSNRPELHGTGSGRVDKKDFTNIVNSGIERASEEYRESRGVFAGNSVLQDYTAKINDKASRVLEHVSTAKYNEILEWLSTVPSSQIHGKYDDPGTKRVDGTCDWVMKDAKFCQWHKSEKSALLWLNGDMKVGTGKSYCTSRVIDWVRSDLQTSNNDGGFAFFYCNKQDSDRSQAKGILRNIIRQLAIGPLKTRSSNTAVEKIVHDLWKKHKTEGIGSTFSEWEQCLVALIETYPRTTIVVDALDECGYDDSSQGQAFINLLVNLVNRGPGAKPVKIFVSGRPQDNLCRHLDTYPTIRMQEKHNANDIARFLQIKISEHHPWSTFPQQFRNEMVREILAMSRDMFLLANLQVQHLKAFGLKSELQSRLKKLPDSVNSIYKEIYHKATSTPKEKRFLDKALRWILCAAKPLTTRELLFAISQEFQSDSIKPQNQDLDEKLMIQWTRNLLSLEDTPGDGYFPRRAKGPRVWRLAHQAVAEFLQESGDCILSVAHCEAGKVCLSLLIETFDPESPGSRIRSDSREGSDKDEDFKCPCWQEESVDYDRARHRLLPGTLVEYAIYAWPTHIRAQDEGKAPGVDILSRTLQAFLGQPHDGSPAYQRWSKHTFSTTFNARLWGDEQRFSIFWVRKMEDPYERRKRTMMPILFASHLGIYTCLSEWRDSPYIDYNAAYHGGYHFLPSAWNWDPRYSSKFSWSLLSLACAHNEIAIIKHVLARNVQLNPTSRKYVPPLVAAVVGGWVELVDLLIKCGANICSPFTTRWGHILLFAIRNNSIRVLEYLIQQPGLIQVEEIESMLTSLDFEEFQSVQAIAILVGKGIDINTPLKVGTLFLAAASNGWDEMAECLIGKGAALNEGAYFGKYDSALHALISSHHKASPEMITLFVKDGAQVNSRLFTSAWRWAKPVGTSDSHFKKRKEFLLMLLEHVSDLDETWKTPRGETSALIEAVVMGEPEVVRLLFKHGANVNLQVEDRAYGDALGSAFHIVLERSRRVSRFPFSAARKMINLLIEEGASLDNLKGDHLNKALAAAALAGWEEPMQSLLLRGASPYKSFQRVGEEDLTTALDAAAMSRHPEAPLIVHTLLNNDTSFMSQYAYYEAARSVFDIIATEVLEDDIISIQALSGDRPSQFGRHPREHIPGGWLAIAYMLAHNHAVWDMDITEWIKLLRSRRLHIWRQNSRVLSTLTKKLAQNRARFFHKFPYAKTRYRWRVKDVESFTQRQLWGVPGATAFFLPRVLSDHAVAGPISNLVDLTE